MKKNSSGWRRKHPFIKGLIILILLLTVLTLALQYYRILGFKETLVSLVKTETDGKYMLSIGAMDVHFWKLSFSLNDILVSKVDPSDSTGILEVKSKQLTVALGSLFSVYTSDQFNIQKLTITEPIAKVGLKDKEQLKEENLREPVNLAHEITQFYPAVESLLSQFDIKLFHIDRAGIELDKSKLIIEIGLLDLLVLKWNMRNLSDEAKLRLSLGPQSIDFANTEFSFGSIAYDYQSNELDLNDYTFILKDSLKRTVIDIKGVSLQVNNLDFKTLYNQENYILEMMLVKEPDITVHIYPHKKKEKKSKYPISDLLKRNLHELQINDLSLKDASLELLVYGEVDTLNVYLPKMNLETKNIVVTEDSSTIMIGALNLELDNTLLELGGSTSLRFSRLRYDDQFNVEIDSIELLNKVTGKDLITCEYLTLYNFDFFHYYFENDLKADSLVLENGKLNTDHGAPRLTNAHKKKPIGGKRKEPPTLHIGKVEFDDINIDVDLGQQQLQAQKISAVIEDLVREMNTSYDLRYLGSPALTYSDPGDAIEVNVTNLIYNQDLMQVGNLHGQYHGLALSVQNFNALLKNNFTLDQPWHHQLSSVELGEIEISGSMPEPKRKEVKNPIPDLLLQKVQLDQFHLDLTMSNDHRLYAIGRDLLLDNPQIVDEKIQMEYAEMNIQQASFTAGLGSYSLGPAVIRSDSNSVIQNILAKTGGDDTIRAEKIEIGPWEKNFYEVTMGHFMVSQLEFIQANGKSTSDSINFYNIIWKENETPYADQVNIYAPNLNFTSNKESKKPGNRGINITPLNMFGEIHIDPGQVTIDNRIISFKGVEIDGEEKNIDLKELAFASPNASFHMNHIWTTETDLNIDTVTIVPSRNFIEQIETEVDVVAGQIYKIQIQDIDWKALIDSNKVVANNLFLDGFDISIRRDKTLPDPEPITKPYLLSEMIPSIPDFSIPRITTNNGNISYHEVGEHTAQDGHITLNDINITLNRFIPLTDSEEVLRGSASFYSQGKLHIAYDQLDSGRFSLSVQLVDFPLEELNQMLTPTQAAKIESGYLSKFEFEILADSAEAIGQAIITYDNLHVKLFKKNSPDEKNFRSGLLTLLVDNIILKHSKENAQADFSKERITHKSPINYWVKAAIQGAISAVTKGKSVKHRKN